MLNLSWSTFQQGRRPQLDRHVGDLAGELHGGHNHIVAFLKDKKVNESGSGTHHDADKDVNTPGIFKCPLWIKSSGASLKSL